MKTSPQIKTLAASHEAFKPQESLASFVMKLLIVISLIILLVYMTLPFRSDLGLKLESFFFNFESALWLILNLATGCAVYFSSYPEGVRRGFQYFCWMLLATLFMVMLYHPWPQDMSLTQILMSEMDLWKGRCGFLIIGLSLLHSLFLFYWAKSGAPATPALTGVFAGLCAASLGCFLMQAVCVHDHATHLVIWHFVPLFLLTLGGQLLGRKLLKW